MKYKEQPGSAVPAESAEKIMHAEISIEGILFYISNAIGQNTVRIGNNTQINLNFDSEDQIRTVYDKLSKGAKINMELQDAFRGALFAMLTDRYGISWSLNYQKPQQK